MIDFEREDVLPLSAAAAFLKKAYGTVHRWAKYGIDGRKLETALLAGSVYTSKQAIQRFSGQVAAQQAESQPTMPPGHEEAMRRLARRGALGERTDAKRQVQEAAVA